MPLKRIAALCTVLLLIPALSVAAVVHVPGDEATIGGALLAAAPYDTVLVAPGTYFVNLEWPATEGIKLVSESGVHTTFLDGRDNGVVITISTGVDTATVVRGFTIQHGFAQVAG
jgi:hypothetical protein